MNWFVKLVILLIALAIGNVYYLINKRTPLPQVFDTWWGHGEPFSEDTSIKPFKINVPNEILVDLQQRLKNSRNLTSPLEGIQQQYGINTKLLKEIVEFWLTKYDWREREKFLNQYPQFKTNIQGLQIHYIHIKPNNIPKNVRVLPLLLLHGWPGSVREFYEIIPLLTTVQQGKNFVFELVIPSLPGYGFSDGAVRPGMGSLQVAVIFKNLMQRLGHHKYYIQGGDWGSAIGSYMAGLYPETVKGIHLNMCFSNMPITQLKLLIGSLWPRLIVDEKYESKMYPLSSNFANALLEFGYMHIQATKPDTIGVALKDSPIGLAAYLTEKFSTWTNMNYRDRADGGLKEKWTYEKLLDNIMIYWVSNSITTSMRMYTESMNKKQNLFADYYHIFTPSACAVFKHELMFQPENLVADKYRNLIHFNYYDDGGHFAAFEVPNLLANDIWLAIEKMENIKK